MAGTELFDRLRDLEFPAGDFAVFGSGPLLVRGIIPSVDDLDVLSRAAAWTHAQTLAPVTRLEPYGVDIVSIDDGLITIGTTWGIGTFDLDELIDTAEDFAGLPFVKLEHVETYKRIARRPKDIAHLELLEAWSGPT